MSTPGFHTAKGETGLDHYQASTDIKLRYGHDRTHSDSPEGRLPQKVATTGVSHGDAFPSEFSVPASKQQKRNHGAYLECPAFLGQWIQSIHLMRGVSNGSR
jgi:hypothetical protein